MNWSLAIREVAATPRYVIKLSIELIMSETSQRKGFDINRAEEVYRSGCVLGRTVSPSWSESALIVVNSTNFSRRSYSYSEHVAVP